MTTPEPTSSQASDADATVAAENDGSDDGGEKGGKGEDEDGEKNGEEEEEDEQEKGAETKSGGDPDAVEKQVNGSVAKDPPTATPDSTAKEKGGSREENSTAPSSVPEENVEKNTSTVGDEGKQVVPTRDPEDDDDDSVTAVIETPDSTTQTNKPTREDRGQLPPFSIHTGWKPTLSQIHFFFAGGGFQFLK